MELLESLLNEALSEESGASSGLSKSEEWLAESQYLLSLWNKAIEELEIIEVTLGDKYDANEVFDRLNLQGQELSALDLIRNFIFGVFGDEAEGALDFYDNQWLDFERGFETPFQSVYDEQDLAPYHKIVSDHKNKFWFPFALTIDGYVSK